MATEMCLKSLQVNLAEAHGEAKPWKATRTDWIKGADEGIEEAASEERKEEAGAALTAPPSSPCEDSSPIADTSAILAELR